MRYLALGSVLVLAACALPGRQTFAPAPVAPSAASLADEGAFAGRIALVTIAPGTPDYAAPLKDAVAQALAIKPSAQFRVVAQCRQAAPDAATACLTTLAPQAQDIAAAIAADGVDAAGVSTQARSGGVDTQLLVYVK
jgi:hypothetical protein